MIIIDELYLIPTQFWLQCKGITSHNTTVRIMCEGEFFRIEFENGEKIICMLDEFKNKEVTLPILKQALSSWLWIPNHFTHNEFEHVGP